MFGGKRNCTYTYSICTCEGVEENDYISTYGLKYCDTEKELTLISDITTDRELLERVVSFLQASKIFRPEQATIFIKALVDADFFIA